MSEAKGKSKGGSVFERMIGRLRQQFEQLPDVRKPSGNLRYRVGDAAMSAFGCFFTQSESFLAYQRDLQRRKGRDNAQRLFGVHQIPSDNQIRNILDPIAPQEVGELFWASYADLERAGHLEAQRGFADTLLIGLDGTQYFSSYALHCDNCTQRQQEEQTLYTHTVIAPVLVAPGEETVISLEPEFILPQDGAEKQDCEQQALKRWVKKHAERFPDDGATVLTDDLHCKQPTCQLFQDHHLNFILVCQPESHPALSTEIALLDKLGAVDQVVVKHWNGRFREIWTYRFVNQVPLRGGEQALSVNWCELTITHAKTHAILYRNAFVTNFPITDANVALIIRSGRARWKTENENHNTLKNHGYHLEHNFGHGHQHLAAFLLTLNLLAFLLHTLLRLTDTTYQALRLALGTRSTFFDDLRTLTRYFVFDSWHHLLTFMFHHLELDQASPPP